MFVFFHLNPPANSAYSRINFSIRFSMLAIIFHLRTAWRTSLRILFCKLVLVCLALPQTLALN